MSSIPNSDSTIVTNIPKFTGTSSHDFLMYLQVWRKYADYKGVASIILYDRDALGACYSRSFRPLSKREQFLKFWNELQLTKIQEVQNLVESTLTTQSWLVPYLITPQKYVVNGVAIKTDWAVHQVANLTPDYCLGWLKHFKYVDQNATVCPRPLLGGNFLPRDSLPVTDLDIMQVKEILTESYLSALMINDFEAARAAYEAESARTDLSDDEFIAAKLGIQIHAFNAFLEKSHFQLQKSITAKSDERKACHECISKFGSLTQIPAAETALRSYNFHLCYTEIQSFYLRMGTNDAELFEKEAKSHRLQLGQDLNTHLTTVCKALERWNTIVFIEEEAMRTNYRDASNYALEHPEIAIDNSGEMTDAEVLATPHRQLVLHEPKRLKIYVQSLADSPRFQHVIHTLYQLPETERTVRKFLNDCRTFESSMLGQMVLQTERSTCPNWKEKAQTHVNKVQSTFELKQRAFRCISQSCYI